MFIIMSDYLCILMILLYSSAWYLKITYHISHVKWRRKHYFDFTGSSKQFIIASLVFFIVLVLTLSELKAHFRRHLGSDTINKKKTESIEDDEE